MYIAAKNFYGKNGMIYRGSTAEAPDSRLISNGLYILKQNEIQKAPQVETKIDLPAETKQTTENKKK